MTGQNRTPTSGKTRRKKRVIWRTAFLSKLSKTGNVLDACKAGRITRSNVYRAREEDERFKAAWDAALDEAADLLEKEARRRAVNGVKEPVFYKGKVVGDIKRFSDSLLMFLLKGTRPDKYRENHKHEVGGVGGAPIAVHIDGLIEKVYGDVDSDGDKPGNA